MAYNELYVGSVENPLYHFADKNLFSLKSATAVSLVGEELSIDTMNATVSFTVINPAAFAPADADYFEASDATGPVLYGYFTDAIMDTPYGTPVFFYQDFELAGKFYVSEVSRSAARAYELHCVSFIGILDKRNFCGGYYEGAKFKDVAEEIFKYKELYLYEAREWFQIDYGCYISLRSSQKNPFYLSPGCVAKIKFIFRGVDEKTAPEATTYYAGIFGETAYTLAGQLNENKAAYAVVCKITRATTTDEWTLGTLDLHIGHAGSVQVVTGPRLVVGKTYDLTVNPTAGVYTVNNVKYAFTAISATPDDLSYRCYINSVFFRAGTTTSSTYELSYPNALRLLAFSVTKAESASPLIDIRFAAEFVKKETARPFDVVKNLTQYIYSYQSGTSIDYTWGPVVPYDAPGFVGEGKDDELGTELFNSLAFEDEVADYEVWGHIPYGTKREALQQLMFASCVSLVKDVDGQGEFCWLRFTTPAATIPDNRIYIGGSQSGFDLVSTVELTEHRYTYESSESAVTLFDNSDGYVADGELVTFSKAPINPDSLTVSGDLVLNCANCNIALVSGKGKLTGRPYQHTENIISKTVDASIAGKTVSVDDATLVSVKNSENLLNRLYSYYTSAQTITNAIVFNNESCGFRYALTSPWEEAEEGYLTSCSVSMSGVNRADCQFVTGFYPDGTTGEFARGAVVLTGSGTWTVPDEVFAKESPSIKVVIIQGGSGGDSGYAGENGRGSDQYNLNNVAATEGGAVGENGSGGKITTVVIPNAETGEELLSSYEYACGAGGKGGGICTSHTENNKGEAGGESTFGSHSSATGYTNDKGVLNYIDRRYYGKKFPSSTGYAVAGLNGYKGTTGRSYTMIGPTSLVDVGAMKRALWAGETPVEADYTYKTAAVPSASRTYYSRNQGSNSYSNVPADGGYPGGAAAGEDGGLGSSAWRINWAWCACGSGGKGGDAKTPGIGAQEADKRNYGCGGYGGNGGGAGGCGGSGNPVITVDGVVLNWAANSGGAGGYGGSGGDGGEGCIIVFW